MIDICLVGACGRMGRRITAAVAESHDTRLSAAVDKPGHRSMGRDIGLVAGIETLGVKVSDNLEAALSRTSVVVDFSLPGGTVRSAEACAASGTPLVTGVTGIGNEGAESLRTAAQRVAVVWAPNMSVGVNLMFKVAGEVARVLGKDFDVEITEIHHRFKKDAPSGTANRLAEIIAEALGGLSLDQAACYGRRGTTGERPAGQIGIHSLRSGDVVGEHTVTFGALGERFEITHRAHSRDTFARGAVTAARFASQAGPGLYDMQDVLGLKK